MLGSENVDNKYEKSNSACSQKYKSCNSGFHHRDYIGSKYPTDKVPIELFYQYEGDSNSKILKACIECRTYKTKQKNKRKAKQNNKEKKITFIKENGIWKCSDESETMICSSATHYCDCIGSKYDKDKVPRYLFRKYPDDPESILYKTCFDCRKYAFEKSQAFKGKEYKEEEPNREEFFTCSSKGHSYIQTKYHKNKIPKDMFLKNPDDPESGYFKTCSGCRDIEKKRREKELMELRKIREEILSSEENRELLLIPCLNDSHRKHSEYDKMKVPYPLFLEDLEIMDDFIYDNCLECRLHCSEKYFQRKEEKIKIATNQGKFFCNRNHIVDKLVKNKDGTMSSVCVDCKQKEKIYGVNHKKILTSIKKEFIREHNCSCQKCKSVYLIPEENQLYVRELKTYEINGERFLKYEGQEYSVKDFLTSHESLLELRIIEFDHLTETEQRERGILKDDEEYIPKINSVANMNSDRKSRRESKKCQHLCSRCHVEETISRYKGTSHRSISQREKFNYVKNLKICGCEICKNKDINLTQFFEMDHLDPKIKIGSLSDMIHSNRYTLKDIIEECKKCRVLCKHCHLIHTDYQRKNGII